MKSLTIIGRRWFQRGPGNTYHTAQIIVDGKTVHKSIKSYGYGDMYVETATQWLEANGYMPDREHHANGSAEPAWRYFRDERGIAYEAQAIDVSRERDL
jgi:hypothetical protein